MDYKIEEWVEGYRGYLASYFSNGDGTFKMVILRPQGASGSQLEAIAAATRKHYNVDRLDRVNKATALNMRSYISTRVHQLREQLRQKS